MRLDRSKQSIFILLASRTEQLFLLCIIKCMECNFTSCALCSDFCVQVFKGFLENSRKVSYESILL